MTAPIFSTSYFPSIEYLKTCLQFDHIQIEQHENYPKQTLRNRCFILSPNGVQCLTVPVQHSGGKKILTRDVKISYEADWQQQHWRSLEAAYNRSAYFEFYKDDLEKKLFYHHHYLIDLNQSLFLWMMQKLKHSITIQLTDTYMEKSSFQTLINKNNKAAGLSPPNQKPYPQVFASKFGFVPNLSGLDWLFNTSGI